MISFALSSHALISSSSSPSLACVLSSVAESDPFNWLKIVLMLSFASPKRSLILAFGSYKGFATPA